MKRNGSSYYKLQKQKGEFASDLHYARVEEISIQQIDKEKISKRFDVIVKKGIKKGKEIEMADGSTFIVKCILMNGTIRLKTWDEIDPLDLTD